MNVTYYKDSRLAYASRNRYKDISNAIILGQENQKAVLLGDGANTSIKTKSSNVCDYVTIDGTRWFVTSYTYVNGGQVVLNLQRDVIGEFGVDSMYGKIERGHTDGILKYRKELSLNQILKKRSKLLPSTNQYGNYLVNNHNNEMWGIFYLIKPNKINSETGQPYEDILDISIPGFTPATIDYNYIENGDYYSYINPADFNEATCKIQTYLKFSYITNINNPKGTSFNPVFINCGFYFVLENGVYKAKIFAERTTEHNVYANFYVGYKDTQSDLDYVEFFKSIARTIMRNLSNELLSNTASSVEYKYSLPSILETRISPELYRNAIVKHNNKYYKYTLVDSPYEEYGYSGLASDESAFSNLFSFWGTAEDAVYPDINERFATYNAGEKKATYIYNNEQFVVYNYDEIDDAGKEIFYAYSYNKYTKSNVSSVEISPSEAGTLRIDLNQQLIDEPYNILVMPLFDVKIYDTNNTLLYTINKDRAFNIFNAIIQYLSGDNPYLVDAQIYPYCPVLTNVISTVSNYPVFSIFSTSYITKTSINLYPNNDVKTEYIENEYNIVAPDQSSVFTFKYYDYKNGNGNNNSEALEIDIKTALKPFTIISSAVIVRDENSLKGINYESNLNGCQPSSNGFECSLSSNAFETYKRNNSNYQAIFDKQMEKMNIEHSVEKTNDIVASVVNTVSAATMGGIAGAAVSDAGIFNTPINKGTGAAIGAGLAGAAVGTAMGLQAYKNDKLREYERSYERTMFNLNIGTVKNIPNSVNRISSFNELIMSEFCYIVETYSCSEFEHQFIVPDFINEYGYEIGVYDFMSEYAEEGWFLRGEIIKSNLVVNLHMIAKSELSGGVYIYEQI